MRRYRNGKIVATLGPASSSKKVIEDLFQKGADVFRLNFSHGAHEDHEKNLHTLREIEKKYNHPIAVIADLQGPKLRIGKFENGSITLQRGETFQLDLNANPGDLSRVAFPHPDFYKVIQEGAELLLNDGKCRVRVENVFVDRLITTVLEGGELSDRKGVNIPKISLPISPLTEKDRVDLEFALSLGVDFVALSFVQKPSDVEEARTLINGRAALIAKIEKPLALEHIEDIVEVSDGIMVARGDLGVEMPPETVPVAQKKIVQLCRREGKPVIVATQMLESMITHSAPTRAEASDVATAIYDGADAVMLSAESAQGNFPVESVAIMDRIIKSVEGDDYYQQLLKAHRQPTIKTPEGAIAEAARQAAETIDAAAIVAYSRTGHTTQRVSRKRPEVPIVGLTPCQQVARKMVLSWGVHSVQTEELDDIMLMDQVASKVVCKEGFACNNARIVVTAGVPLYKPGATNMLRIVEVREEK